MSTYGIVQYFGCNDSSYPCGYCKAIRPDNADYGMWSHSLSPTNYQNLIDRNWRRSGKYCYKPILDKTCCPMYTIRCDALNFKLTKSQKKVVKKFNRFLVTGEKPSKRPETELHNIHMNDEQITVKPVLSEETISRECQISVDSSSHFDVASNKCQIDVDMSEEQKQVQTTGPQKRNKARTLRKERKLKKIMEREKCDEAKAKDIMDKEFKSKIKVKTIEDYVTEYQKSANTTHKLEIKFVSTTTDEYEQTFRVSHEVYKKYQMTIHGDTDDKCTLRQYKRFLVDSPLENEYFETNEQLPNNFGSFHQQYWLDDKLIAVGVLDILPSCVSSVYLYYDPDYDFLSLGTYSALREICLVRQLQKFIPSLRYYYMGFYIHSCPKMAYKAKFLPSDLLCPETFTWHPISKCIPKLDLSKYSRFEEDLKKIDRDGDRISDREIMILYTSQVMNYQQLRSTHKNVSKTKDQKIKEYARLVGRKCCTQMLLYSDS